MTLSGYNQSIALPPTGFLSIFLEAEFLPAPYSFPDHGDHGGRTLEIWKFDENLKPDKERL